jgi:hypothetical protein
MNRAFMSLIGRQKVAVRLLSAFVGMACAQVAGAGILDGDAQTRGIHGGDAQTRGIHGGDARTRGIHGGDAQTRGIHGGDARTRGIHGGDARTRGIHGGDARTRGIHGGDARTRGIHGGDARTRGIHGGDARTRGIHGGDAQTRGIHGGDARTRGIHGGDARTRGIHGGDSRVRDGASLSVNTAFDMAQNSGPMFETVTIGGIDEIIDAGSTSGIVVLGTFYAVDPSQLDTLEVGTYVLAAATDSMGLSSVVLELDEPYVPGASAVWLRNVVTSTNARVATTMLGSVTVDYSSELSTTSDFLPVVGSTLELAGLQPVKGGSVIMGIHGGDSRRD